MVTENEIERAEPSRGAPQQHKFGANNICEGCGHSLGWIQEKRMDLCDRDPRDWLLEQQRQELILLKSGHVVLLRRATEFRRDNVQMESVGKARPAEELVMASFAADIVRECAEIAAPSRRDAILRKFGLEKE